jgi:hypothetical protein
MGEDLFKDYVPEVIEYDEAIDGSDEYKIRENHLETKENLLEKIRKAKSAAKGNKTTFRQNIRTENEQTKKDPFKDYVPEVIEYDEKIDN